MSPDTIAAIQSRALAEIAAASDAVALAAARIRYLGKQGEVTALGEAMRNISKEDRPAFGKLLNELRAGVTDALVSRESALEAARDEAALAAVDVTLPPVRPMRGSIHPLTQLLNRAVKIFRGMGFAMAEGPDIETEWHCFDALNTPADHPARNELDTFYLPDGRLLRSHTSTVQIRAMCEQAPPLRIIAPGAAYRRDETDATHLAQFTQMEGLCVAPGISLADLKGTLEFFFCELFGDDTETRFRPHFFPFTEPSVEVDFSCHICKGKGCRICKQSGWIEIMGAGMVDPRVYAKIGYPEDLYGYAFGMGVERIAMIKHGITDLRHLYTNDLRFLAQFA